MHQYIHRIIISLSLMLLFAGVTGITLAREVKVTHNDELLKGAYYRQKYADTLLRADDRIEFLDSLISLRPTDTYELLRRKLELCFDRGFYTKAIIVADSLLDSENLSLADRCRIMLIQAIALSNSGNYARLLECAPALIDLQKPDSLCYFDAAAYELISNMSYQFKDPMAYESLQKVEEMWQNAQTKKMSTNVIGALRKSLVAMKADSAYAAGDINLKLMYQEELLKMPLNNHERVGVRLNLGMTYLNLGKEDVALDIFLGLLNEPPSQRNHGMALVNALHILNSQERYSEAIDLYEKYEDRAAYIDESIGLPYLLANRAMSYAGIGDYKEAYALMEKAMSMTDAFRSTLNSRAAGMSMQLGKSNRTIKDLGESLNKGQTIIWIVGCGAILMCALTVMLWYKLRKTKREYESLSRDATEAHDRELKYTPDFMRLARVNESMEQIDSICREKRMSDKVKLERIVDQLDRVSLLENSWEVFQHNFEGVHSGFFRTLSDRNPDLSPAELRMCAYVAMHLSSKEIATLTGRTTRSVDSMRYRIQKKLGISGKDSLLYYLLNMT